MYNPAKALKKDAASYIECLTYGKAIKDGKSKEEAKRLANKARREFLRRNR